MKMSYYTDRWILFGQETSGWGTIAAANTFVNYLMSYDTTVTENKNEEAIIAGSRDQRKRVWLSEEVSGRFTYEPLSAKFLGIFGLGAATVTGTSPYTHTFTGAATVPSFTWARGLYPDTDGSSTLGLGFYGCKVDSWELTLEQSNPIQVEVNFVGKGAQTLVPGATSGPGTILPKGSVTVNYTLNPLSFYQASVVYNNNALTYARRLVITVNNNLEARFSAGAGTFECTSLKEGFMEISGRLSLDAPLGTFAADILNRTTSACTIQCTLTSASNPASTIVIQLNNITFGELPDAATGLDPIEIELPFTARASSGYDAIQLKEINGSSVSTLSSYIMG